MRLEKRGGSALACSASLWHAQCPFFDQFALVRREGEKTFPGQVLHCFDNIVKPVLE